MDRNVTFLNTSPKISHSFQCILHYMVNLWDFCACSIIRYWHHVKFATGRRIKIWALKQNGRKVWLKLQYPVKNDWTHIKKKHRFTMIWRMSWTLRGILGKISWIFTFLSHSIVYPWFRILRSAFFVYNIAREICIEVTIFVCVWCQSSSSKSKRQIRVFVLCYTDIPYFLLVVYNGNPNATGTSSYSHHPITSCYNNKYCRYVIQHAGLVTWSLC